MKRLNLKATKIFCRLIDIMQGSHLTIENDPFMPLTVKLIGQAEIAPFGTAKLYSVCHHYIHDGDSKEDPEMCFAVVDDRAKVNRPELVTIVPYLFHQVPGGVYQESIILEGNRFKEFNPKLQADHCDFANFWMENIKAQDFIK